VFNDFILAEIPCAHGGQEGDDLLSRIQKSCRKVDLLELDDDAFKRMKDVIAALA